MATGPVQSDRKPGRRIVLILLAWLCLVAMSAVSHWAVWIALPGTSGGDDSGPGMVVKCIASIFNVICSPGWAIVNKLTGHWHMDSVGVVVLVACLSWAGWLLVIAAICSLRAGVGKAGPIRGIRSRPSREPSQGVDSAAPRPTPADRVRVSRRGFLLDGTLGLGCVSVVAAVGDATLVEPWNLRVTRYDIPITGLPDSLVGLKLVQLSDTHLGPRIPASFIRDAVARTIALAPHVVLLTGDYVHNGPPWIEPAARLFEPLVAPGRAVVGVLGNHDWWAGGRRVSDALTRIGVRMVDNGRCFYDARTRAVGDDFETSHADHLCIAGVGDLREDHVDFSAALSGVPDSMPRLMLAHRPDTAELAELRSPRPPRIDLMLCGHTHGGQVRLPIIGTPVVPSRYGSKYAAGLVQGPGCRVLVSRGVGMSILPLRFGVPPEIVEITLTRSGAAPNNHA